ncbi:hypothetical protein ALP72_04671 [Pseudomonas coronafaciens pv. coronafaciens]|nr:hypothetical protein ALP72_04671 [Pseudomonas coronafaciens pv. coronafaciens]RMS15770.1 hypothetical protein ALP71_03981 [Pseudomonas coronafaciens pv. garcae]
MYLRLLRLSIFNNGAYYLRVLFVEIGNVVFGVMNRHWWRGCSFA